MSDISQMTNTNTDFSSIIGMLNPVLPDDHDLDQEDIDSFLTPRVLNLVKKPETNEPKLMATQAVNLPAKFDLSSKLQYPVLDQKSYGCCSSCATMNCYNFLDQAFDGSLLFVYYNSRAAEGNASEDSGATNRTAISTTVSSGICRNEKWPYSRDLSTKPDSDAYTNAQKHKASVVVGISNTLYSLKLALTNGFPVSLGIPVYDSFQSLETFKTGTIPDPTADDQLLGYHAVVVVAYDDAVKRFTLLNSWSNKWPKANSKGLFTLSYGYITKYAFDCWQIKQLAPSNTDDSKKDPKTDPKNDDSKKQVDPNNNQDSHIKTAKDFSYSAIYNSSNKSIEVSFLPKTYAQWVDIHFKFANQIQQNIRMTKVDQRFRYLITNVDSQTLANTINYSFTYLIEAAVDSESYNSCT